METGIYPGKRRVSYRHRMIKFCEVNDINIEKGFDDVELSKIALIDISIEQRPLLLKVTFNREKSAYEYLLEINKHPSNYRVLNFKTGKEYSLEIQQKPVVTNMFNNQKEADPTYG